MAFPKISGLSKEQQLMQSYIERALVPLQASPYQDGVLLQDVVLLSSGPNQVAHKLGKTPYLWTVARLNADARIWETAVDSNFLTLQCSANCTVSLWVRG